MVLALISADIRLCSDMLTFGILGAVGHEHLEAGHVAVPRAEALRVLRRHARRHAVGAAECDRHLHYTRRHVVRFRCRVYYLKITYFV